ncbi:MAG TPA: helicase-exonuclease AddAB subunit AddA [Clostridiales bacterium]|jgi:ATP-dependent helicase/nuclease subunit A|nr:helicase-exonuclease AddAB subunit AddA [Clostridiales bacterium]
MVKSMANVKWTEEQQQAIKEKGANILVAAAAGSGKTAVLVERIINKVINEKIDIDRILVVTFTSAAASEIRERILEAIYKKLEENPEDTNLQKQINLINKANISTIHSFCLDVIRNNFYELDISSNFRVADTTEIELMKYEVLDELFEEKYLSNDKDFEDLINIYTGYRGDEGLQNLVLNIYKFIQSSPFPEKWLNDKVNLFKNTNQDFAQTIWGKTILENIEEELTEGIMQLQNILKDMKKIDELSKFTKIIQEDIYNLEDILRYTNSWDNTLTKINNLVWQKWPTDKKITIDLKEQAKEVRNKVKEIINKSIKKKIAYDSIQANEDINEMHVTLTKLKNLLVEFMFKFASKKKEKNVVDFNDIEHFALKILIGENGEATELAKKYREKFQEIAIDEYQDSNLVQEQILTSISKGNNIFMVGDVKQSIYKFRQARPELFLEKYKNYNLKQEISGNSLGLKIQLFKNFRSRENILNITNLVFQNIMSEKVGEIEYNEKEYLNYSAGYKEPEENTDYAGKTELHIIDLKEKEEIFINDEEIDEKIEVEKIENSVLEAKFVAKKINELLNSNYMVFDKEQGYRKITPKDIIILLRATTNIAPIYEKELADLNLPVFSDSSSQYLDTMEIQIIVSILKIINNPIQDIPLVTVLRSPIFAFTDNDLISIRLTDKSCSFYESMIKARLVVNEQLNSKIDNVIYYLEKWKQEEKYLPLDELIWQIYIDTNLINIVGLMPNGAIRQANLKMLFEKAKQFENASFKGLFNFINFIDRLKNNNGDLSSAKLIGENENVIRIMSIHKSKGLEFPVVFLCGTGKSFNMRDLNEDILLHQDMGIGPKLIDFERRIEYDTLAKEAIKLKIKLETLSEEQRILYVALTRAKEKLIITGISKDLEKDFKQKRELLQIYNENMNIIDYKLVKKYKTYLDWLELVYLKNENKITDIATLYTYTKTDLEKELNNKEQEKLNNIKEKIFENTKDLKDTENIKEILNWKYRYKKSSEIPTKTAVTRLQAEEDKKIELTEIPKFMGKEKKITPAEKGTLMHLCIQRLNEKQTYTKETIKQMIQSLVLKEIITTTEADAINIDTLYKYTKSALWNDLSKAKEIHKEQPFYINIPAKEIYENIETDENILVQGIIDLYYISEDNKLILIDYKTDYVKKPEELINKYKTQLSIYKKALENSLNRRVDETYIFSTNWGQSLNVPFDQFGTAL